MFALRQRSACTQRFDPKWQTTIPLCSACGRRSRDNPQPNGYTPAERERILRAYHERSSLLRIGRRLGVIAPFIPYLRQRWEEGCRSLKQLLAEITERGYQYRKTPLWRLLMDWRAEEPGQLPRKSLLPGVKTPPPIVERRGAVWLLQKETAKWQPEEASYLDRLCQLCPELSHTHQLCQAFTGVVRGRDVNQLDQWLEDAAGSNVAELKSFAKGLRQDYQAVRAALTHEWSQGQVKGQVNRLKLLKRQMYGRAKFDLLRARVLYAG